MSVIYLVIPLALTVVFVAVIAYVWATRDGQFDDLDTPPIRMLHEDEGKKEPDPTAAGDGEEE
jgi:cbb3-type cytochrome oxidase maturation protein